MAAGGEKAGHDAVAGLEALDLAANLLHHADKLVAEHGARIHRGMSVKDVEVGSANSPERDPDQRFVRRLDVRFRHVDHLDVAFGLER